MFGLSGEVVNGLREYCARSLSQVWLFAILWTVAPQALLSMGFFRHTGVGCHFLLPGIFSTRDWTCISWTAGEFFITEPLKKLTKNIVFLSGRTGGLFKRTAPPWQSQTNKAFSGALGLGYTQERSEECRYFLSTVSEETTLRFTNVCVKCKSVKQILIFYCILGRLGYCEARWVTGENMQDSIKVLVMTIGLIWMDTEAILPEDGRVKAEAWVPISLLRGDPI